MPRIDGRDWSALTLGEHIRQIEVEGYMVLPDLLSAEQIQRLKAETARLDAVEAGISTAYRTRWHQLGGFAAFFALAALLLCFSRLL